MKHLCRTPRDKAWVYLFTLFLHLTQIKLIICCVWKSVENLLKIWNLVLSSQNWTNGKVNNENVYWGLLHDTWSTHILSLYKCKYCGINIYLTLKYGAFSQIFPSTIDMKFSGSEKVNNNKSVMIISIKAHFKHASQLLIHYETASIIVHKISLQKCLVFN